MHTAVERAREALPTHDARITRALALVTEGHVTPLPDGAFQVQSQRQGGRKVYLVNGHCTCPDSARVSDGLCKHMLATLIWRRAQTLCKAETSSNSPQTPAHPLDGPAPAEVDLGIPSGVPPQYISHIQGKAFVRFAGLLIAAQARGLQSLTADWTYNDSELSLAHAVATFRDGRRFAESGDASPTNCTRLVQAHFRRVALTRAKARVLRDALGIDLVAVEELSDSD